VATDEPEAVKPEQDDALVSRLRVIEDQPLETRADAYLRVHDELREVLEGGDIQRAHD
jgi:hypothetical protein